MAQFREYVQTSRNAFASQALNVAVEGKLYDFNLLHVTLDLYRDADKKRRLTEHAHDVFHIVLYTEGTNAFSLQSKRCPLQPGTLALVSPGTPHDFYVLEKGSATYSEMTFSYADRNNDPLRIGFNRLLSVYAGVELPDVRFPCVLASRKRRELEALLRQLFGQLTTSGKMSGMLASQTILAVFTAIVRECFLNKDGGESPVSNPVQRVRAHLDYHYAERIAIRELASMACMSPGYFLRAFRKAVGVPPIAYQQRLRIEAAQTLLRCGSLRCKEIAGRVGYDDIYHFFKIFKKTTGLSPMAYRRKHQAATCQA